MRTALATLLVSAACGGGDSSAPDAAPAIDATPIQRTDRAYILQYVAMPATMEEVDETLFTWPNSSTPVNKLGGLMTVMQGLTTGIDVPGNVDAGFQTRGVYDMLLVRSADLDGSDPGVTVFGAHVVDADGNPANDFDGTGQVRLDAGEQLEIIYDQVTLDAGMLDGFGGDDLQITLELYFLETTEPPWIAPGVHPMLRMAIDENRLIGVGGSATTQSEIATLGYPGLAAVFTRALELGTPNANQIEAIFDTDPMDGAVTIAELEGNDTMATLTSPDIDLDGDGVNDHVSQAVFIDAVRVELVP